VTDAPRVLLVGDSSFAQDLAHVLDSRRAAHARVVPADAEDLLRRAQNDETDLIVFLPEHATPPTLDLVARLRAAAPRVGCVLIAEDPGPIERDALRAGAVAVIANTSSQAAADAIPAAGQELARRRELLDRYTAANKPEAGAGGSGNVIAVVSAKANVGCSFVVANLASVLAERGGVAIVDLDTDFADISSWGGAAPRDRTLEQLAPVVVAGEVTEQDFRSVATTRFGRAQLLPSVGRAVAHGSWTSNGALPVAQIVSALRSWYSWVVVDGGAGSNEQNERLVASASLLVVVTTAEIGSLRATRAFLKYLRELSRAPINVVVNRANRGERSEVVRDALGLGHDPIRVNEDRSFARRLVLEGLAAGQQRNRRMIRGFNELAQQITRTVRQS